VSGPFPLPLIKLEVRISRIQLSDWLHGGLTTLRPHCDGGSLPI